MTKTVNLEISKDLIEKRIKKILIAAKEPQVDLVVKALINNLEKTEVGFKQLFLAFMGIEDIPKYSPGEIVKINQQHCCYWRYDKAVMKTAGYIDESDLMVAKVIQIDMYRHNQINIEYQYLDDKGAIKTDATWTQDSFLLPVLSGIGADPIKILK